MSTASEVNPAQHDPKQVYRRIIVVHVDMLTSPWLAERPLGVSSGRK